MSLYRPYCIIATMSRLHNTRSIIITVLFLVVAANAQQVLSLFPKDENFVTDPLLTAQRSFREIIKHGAYIIFSVAINDTDGVIMIYKNESTSGDYSLVNRIHGSSYIGDSIASNSEWIAIYDGSTREVNFFQLDLNHQVVNNVRWGYTSLTTWYQSFRLMSDNNFVTIDYVYSNLKVQIYKYTNNSWASTSVFSMPCPSAATTYLADAGVVILDTENSIVSIYDYYGDNFTLVHNLTLPFQLLKNGRNVFAYDGVNTLVFVKNVYEVLFLEWSEEAVSWTLSTINWNMTENTNTQRSYISFYGNGVYIANYEYNFPDNLQGAIFEFKKLDSNWTNTAIYKPYSKVVDKEGFLTNAGFGFTVTNNAVFGLARSYDTNSQASFGAFQLQYTLLSCLDEVLDVTCHDQTVSCDTTSISAADLVTANKPCGHITVTSNNSTTIPLDFSKSKSVTVTLTAFRLGNTAQCDSTIQCSNDASPAGPNEAPSSGSPTPVRTPSGSSSEAVSLLLATFVTFFCVSGALLI